MKAMIMEHVTSLMENDTPLRQVDLPSPKPANGEVLIKISACGVCHTELDEIEGRLLPPRLPIVPGHQIVGEIIAVNQCALRTVGQRVGVGWIHHSTGKKNENISDAFVGTGLHVNGGYAEFVTVPETYAYPIPEQFSDVQAAPLLCAGAIGYRALKLTQISDGDALGFIGFGNSAHLVLQLVQHIYPRTQTYVFARDAEARALASELGATWVGEGGDRAPVKLDAVIDTTPAWKPVLNALENLRPGGRLVINAIRKEDADKTELLNVRYHDHLWLEREIKSVANITQFDIAEFLPIAARIPIVSTIETFTLEEANKALIALKRRPSRGAKVLEIS